MPPITGKQSRRVARSMGSRAGGADGLQTADWADLPIEHWCKLAQLVQLFEQLGKWPQQFGQAHVMLLSKGGQPVDKLQARPMTVLALVSLGLPGLGPGTG